MVSYESIRRWCLRFGAEFDTFAGKKKLPPETVQYYIDVIASDSDALGGSFRWYQAIQETASQNEKRKVSP